MKNTFLPEDYEIPEPPKPYEEWKDRYCDKVQDQEFRWGGERGSDYN